MPNFFKAKKIDEALKKRADKKPKKLTTDEKMELLANTIFALGRIINNKVDYKFPEPAFYIGWTCGREDAWVKACKDTREFMLNCKEIK